MLIVVFSSPRVTSIIKSLDGMLMIIEIFVHLHEASSVLFVRKEIIVLVDIVIRAKRFGF